MLDLLLSKEGGFFLIGGVLLLVFGKALKILEVFMRNRAESTGSKLEAEINKNKGTLDELGKKNTMDLDTFRKLRDEYKDGKGK